MIELLTCSGTNLPESLKWQALSFLRMEYPLGFTGRNRLRDWVTCEEDHPIYIMLVEKGILISHANIVWKFLAHAGVVYKAYGLTGVFTYPSFRGEGHGSRVVEAGTRSILQSDADVAMLFCDESLKRFYARHGWIPMEGSVSYTGEGDRLARVNDETLMMLFISPKGQQGRPSFEHEPIHFVSEYTW